MWSSKRIHLLVLSHCLFRVELIKVNKEKIRTIYELMMDGAIRLYNNDAQQRERSVAPGARFSKDPKTWPRKAIAKLPSASFRKLIFQHVFKITQRRITAKFDNLKPLSSWETEGIALPEKVLKSFGAFEKRTPGATDRSLCWDSSKCPNSKPGK